MTTSKRALLLGLSHTRDVDLAVRLLDQLGTDLNDATSPLSFPPHWVLTAQRGPAAKAAWAVRHCADPDILATIARTKNLRQSVRSALLGNPHLSAPIKQTITTYPGPGAPSWQIPAPANKEHAEYLLSDATILQQTSRYDLLETLHQLKGLGETSYVDRFVEAFAKINNQWLLDDILLNRYLGRSVYASYTSSVYTCSNYSTPELLMLYPEHSRHSATSVFMREIIRSPEAPAVKIDADVMQIILEGYVPEVWNSSRLAPLEWLTPKAFDLIFNDPVWSRMLSLAHLSDSQVQELIDQTPSEHSAQLPALIYCEADYPRIETVLRAIPPGTVLDASYAYFGDFLQAAFQTRSDELINRTLELCTNDDLLVLLNAEFTCRKNEKVVLPPIEYLPGIIARIGSELATESVVYSMLYNASCTNPLYPPEFTKVLVDLVPGLAYRLDPNDYPSLAEQDEYIFESLAGTGFDIEMALNLFSSQPDSSLSQMVAALKAMAAAKPTT